MLIGFASQNKNTQDHCGLIAGCKYKHNMSTIDVHAKHIIFMCLPS